MEKTNTTPHVHDPEEKRKQINRMAKLIGHLESVKKMIEEDKDCSQVLMQLAACKSALNGLSKTIIEEHMNHCVVHAIENGDLNAIEDFQEAIKKYI